MSHIHYSVMKNEALKWLAPQKDNALLVDGTLGEGGHSHAFLEAFPTLNVIGLDADSSIQEKAKARLAEYGSRMKFQNIWFDDFFKTTQEDSVHRILLDLGISVFHYQQSQRGFSFAQEEKLDMRLNPQSGESAWDLVNSWDPDDLANVIYKWGEERYSRRIARAIQAARPVNRADELADVISRSVPPAYRRGRIHPATRTFQALRMQVNQEMPRLQRVLQEAFRSLEVGGRLGIIAFHSLEDRAVKQFFNHLHRDCLCLPEAPRCTCGDVHRGMLCFKKPLIPQPEEVGENSPSRSAKFRVIEKLIPQVDMP
ncbi:MAG: 16S rRNA (cytosine(1402)-N(4))-methyltransferase RsmH [Spirochaetaceae bacterium]|nr:16S rRNA (cytosine(1402)-N(4))-methyltransferase RsmH [Spirochaetaceae bacterium]